MVANKNQSLFLEVYALLRWTSILLGCLVFNHSLAADSLTNPEAVIPSQCYTKTEGNFNPCYVCHQSYSETRPLNYMKDGELQGEYSFSDFGATNRWSNLFKSRETEIGKISDDEILQYVRQDNYTDLLGIDSEGYVPDLHGLHLAEKAFAKNGLAKDGSGWMAFNYKPFPSTFWPTNGSFDDVMIRLPEKFQQFDSGQYSSDVYLVNLALLEMVIKDLNTLTIHEVDERQLNIDLDGDGKLQVTDELMMRNFYIGKATSVETRSQQYPVGTEFLHSVRYLDVNEDGEIVPAARMKELRYSVKYKSLNDEAILFMYNQERREKEEGRMPKYAWAKPAGLAGLNNKMGWYVQGWIEGADGALRAATFEENLFCMGCHTTIGSTIDHSFSFPRKVPGAKGWGYLNLRGMEDVPTYGEEKGEFLTYFERVGGGDEFRQNTEMLDKWFKNGSEVNSEKVMNADIYQLIIPTKKRALALNKAYKLIVDEQSFIKGRDAVIGHPTNVFSEVDGDQVPLLPEEKQFNYDLRLSWH